MITAEQKSFEDIYEMVKEYKHLHILGCNTCVTVCMAGGEKEVSILASTLRLKNQANGVEMTVTEGIVERQCDREFYEPQREAIEKADAVLSTGCGVGVQLCSEIFEGKRVLPALNTKFYGATDSAGAWSVRCAGCGSCMLDQFGGVCPIARCSKSLLNGPCGGSQDGKCELDPENTECGWQLIYDRMKTLGILDRLEENEPIKDWSTGRDGGPGKIIKDDVQI